MNKQLLIIDPQNDFIDGPEQRATLPVKGANQDMWRLEGFMDRQRNQLSGITVTLDTHELLDIGHPDFWMTNDGAAPAPFTPVTLADVKADRLYPRDRGQIPYVLDYLEALEHQGRYTHMIWPVHCQVGTWGHNVAEIIQLRLNQWERAKGEPALRILKGMNRLTEHYSAVRAEVVNPRDAHTQTNQRLVEQLNKADVIYVAGEALSHCVKATVLHLVGALRGRDAASRMVLLTDAMSSVTGFEAEGEAFLADMKARGATLAKTGDF